MLIGISGYIGSGKDTFASMLNYQIYTRRYMVYQEKYNSKIVVPKSYDEWVTRKAWTGWEIRKFADSLKQIVALLTGCTREQLEDQSFKESTTPECWNRTWKDAADWLYMNNYYPSMTMLTDEYQVRKLATELGFKWRRTYREILQEVGTELFRTHFHPETWVNALMSGYRPISVPGDNSHYLGESMMSGLLNNVYKWPNWLVTDVRFPNEAKAIQNANGILIRINRGKRTSDHASETALDYFKEFDVMIDNTGSFSNLLEQAEQLTEQLKLYDYADTNNKPIMG